MTAKFHHKRVIVFVNSNTKQKGNIKVYTYILIKP